MNFGILGGGSWATALAKMLTSKRYPINWWVRNPDVIAHIRERHHNPHYLRSASFDVSLLHLSPDIEEVIRMSDFLVVAIPSAYIEQSLGELRPEPEACGGGARRRAQRTRPLHRR